MVSSIKKENLANKISNKKYKIGPLLFTGLSNEVRRLNSAAVQVLDLKDINISNKQ